MRPFPAASLWVIADQSASSILAGQTYQDFVVAAESGPVPKARYVFRYPEQGAPGDQTLEECFWALQFWPAVAWTDTPDFAGGPACAVEGPIAFRTEYWDRKLGPNDIWRLPWPCRPDWVHFRQEEPFHGLPSARPKGLQLLYENLIGAKVLNLDSWLQQPFDTALRLVPFHVKAAVNSWTGRPTFDLGFYRRFERNLYIRPIWREPLLYAARPKAERTRVAFCTPNLGYGGAESVLLSVARQLDRSRYELFLVTTNSADSRMEHDWRSAVDHVYDLGNLAPREEIDWVLQSMAHSWHWDCLVVQNSFAGYEAAVALSQSMPSLKKVDILHNLNAEWDFHSATAAAAKDFDRRVVISRAGERKLLQHGTAQEAIRLIRTGVDLKHFDKARYAESHSRPDLDLAPDTRVVLFAGHLIERKRPCLLVEIDRELQSSPDAPPYCFVVAGDGPERPRLEQLVAAQQAQDRFRLLGHRDDIASLLAAADALIVLSIEEGTPLVISEAMAMQVPALSTRVGAVEEILPNSAGVLIDEDAALASSFALALVKLFDDPSLRRLMGRAGREFVASHHDAARSGEQYRALVEELVPACIGRGPAVSRSVRPGAG